MTTATTPQQHLQTVTDHWTLLADMLDTHVAAPWPPAGRMSDYLRSLEYADTAVLPPLRGGRTELEVGAGAAPLNLDALDAARTVEIALLETADHIASQVQRPAVTVNARQGWTDDVHRQTALLAARDTADPRRWSYTNQTTRTPVHAAIWLQHRLDDAPGPFRPLTLQQWRRVTDVAVESSTRVEAALAQLRRTSRVPYPCPACRTRSVVVTGSDGHAPTVHCQTCERTWSSEAA